MLGGYQTGFELVDGTQPDSIENFTVICSKGTPRLLLPTSRPLMRTAMTNFLGGRSVASLMPLGVQMAARAGGPFSRISSNVSLMSKTGAPSPLRELISTVIGRDDFQIALRASFGRPNAKTVSMAISDAGEVLCYVKLGSDAMTSELVAHESTMLEQLERTDMPVIIPSQLYSGTWADGQNIMITEALQLAPLKRNSHVAHTAAGALARQTQVASSALVNSAYWRRVVEFVAEYGDSQILSTAVADIERAWGSSEFDFGASHGDWTRANVGMVGERVAALDWERCSKDAPIGIDIAHFALCEKTARPLSKSLNIGRVAENVRQYLKAADLRPDKAEVLILFALLEMVIRFKSAQNAGLKSTDLKFGPALDEGIKRWASR